MFLFNNRWNGTLVQAVPRIKSKDLEEILAPQLQTLPSTQVAVLAEVADLAVRCVDMQVGLRLSPLPLSSHSGFIVILSYSLVFSRILSYSVVFCRMIHGLVDRWMAIAISTRFVAGKRLCGRR